ncbi:hypothetical protein SIK49_16190, partial [Clostridioides difficile]|nr:hypothetical protein [Clostridioides difficile]
MSKNIYVKETYEWIRVGNGENELTEIEYEKLDMNNFTRTRYKVDKSTDDYYANILTSKRYKKYLYVSVLYATSTSSENNNKHSSTIDIIKLNQE